MKSVLFAKIEAPTYKSDAMVRAFTEAGFDQVHTIDWQQYRYSFGVEEMRRQLIRTAEITKPTVIFLHIQNQEAIDLETVKELSKHGKVINYTFDIRDKERTEWMYEFAPHIWYTFFGCQEDVDECRKRGYLNTAVLQSSCDMDLYKPLDVNTNSHSPAPIVFLGNNFLNTNLKFEQAQERVRMVEYLKKNYGEYFRVWGMNWDKNSRVVNFNEECYIYNQSKIAIVQNNYNRILYFSDRIWRAMASGAFVLCKYVIGMETFFTKRVHLDWFHDLDEMRTLIDKYLYEDDLRRQIAKAGCELVRSKHTWTERFKDMLTITGIN